MIVLYFSLMCCKQLKPVSKYISLIDYYLYVIHNTCKLKIRIILGRCNRPVVSLHEQHKSMLYVPNLFYLQKLYLHHLHKYTLSLKIRTLVIFFLNSSNFNIIYKL